MPGGRSNSRCTRRRDGRVSLALGRRSLDQQMSYTRGRRGNWQQQQEQWRSWCAAHAALIEASNVPAGVFADEERWRGFLEISDLYPVDFDHNSLPLAQKAALLRLINTRPVDRRTPVAGCMIDAVLNALEPRVL